MKRNIEQLGDEIIIPLENSSNAIVVKYHCWSDTEPAEINVYVTDTEQYVQDIALVREHKDKQSVEVLVWSDNKNEDYTDKFDIELTEELKEEN